MVPNITTTTLLSTRQETILLSLQMDGVTAVALLCAAVVIPVLLSTMVESTIHNVAPVWCFVQLCMDDANGDKTSRHMTRHNKMTGRTDGCCELFGWCSADAEECGGSPVNALAAEGACQSKSGPCPLRGARATISMAFYVVAAAAQGSFVDVMCRLAKPHETRAFGRRNGTQDGWSASRDGAARVRRSAAGARSTPSWRRVPANASLGHVPFGGRALLTQGALRHCSRSPELFCGRDVLDWHRTCDGGSVGGGTVHRAGGVRASWCDTYVEKCGRSPVNALAAEGADQSKSGPCPLRGTRATISTALCVVAAAAQGFYMDETYWRASSTAREGWTRRRPPTTPRPATTSMTFLLHDSLTQNASSFCPHVRPPLASCGDGRLFTFLVGWRVVW